MIIRLCSVATISAISIGSAEGIEGHAEVHEELGDKAEVANSVKSIGQDPPAVPEKDSGAKQNVPNANPLVRLREESDANTRLDGLGTPMPAGMVQRFGGTRFKETGWWRQLAFAGNDEWVWLKADDRVAVMHRATGRIVKHRYLRLGRDSRVHSIAATADGTLIAIGMVSSPMDETQIVKYRVVVLSALTTVHTAEIEWQERSSDLRCLSLSDDGKTLLTGAGSGDVRLWNVDTGELLKQRSFAGADLWDAALSPDGRTAVLAGLRDSFLWLHSDGAEPIRLDQQNSEAARFAPNGSIFATAGREGARIWNAVDGKLMADLKSDSGVSSDGGIAFTPDGRTLAVPVSGANSVELWDVETQQQVATMPVHEPRSVAISHDGKWLAATGGDSVVSIFDLANRQLVSTPGEGHISPPIELLFTHGGELVTSCYENAYVWDVASGKTKHILAHENPTTIRGLAISPDNTTIVTSDFDDSLGVWDRTTGKRIFTLKGHGEFGACRTVRFTADGSQFISWGDDAQLRRWDAKQGTLMAELDVRPPGFQGPNELRELRGALTQSGDVLFVKLKDTLFEFETKKGNLVRQIPAEFNSKLMAVSPDGKWLASATTTRDAERKIIETDIVLIDLTTLKVVRRWPVVDSDFQWTDTARPNHIYVGDGNQLAFSPDSQRLAWAQEGDRNLIVVADVTREKTLLRIPIDTQTWCITFSPDGNQLASGQHNTTISLWDLRDSTFVVAEPGTSPTPGSP